MASGSPTYPWPTMTTLVRSVAVVFLARLHRRAREARAGPPWGGFPARSRIRPARFPLAVSRWCAENQTFAQQPNESGGNMTVSVVIQERPRLLREGLGLILDAEPEIELVGSVVSGDALFATVREDDTCRRAARSGCPRMGPVSTRLPTSASVALHALRRLVRREGEAEARARRCGLRRLVSLRANARELVDELMAPVRSGTRHHPAAWPQPLNRVPADCPRDPGLAGSSVRDALRGRSGPT